MSIQSWAEEQLRIAAKQRKRCQELYPDWKDDEFNCADNKFVWGISHNSEQVPSFSTLNFIQVYYNRQYKIYYLELDPEIDCSNLKKVANRFEAYVALEGLNGNKKLSIEEVGLDLFSAASLEDLLFKFKIFVRGYLNV